MKHNVSLLVKALLDLSLGHFGTVGVLTVEDFVVRMKTMFHEAVDAHSPVVTCGLPRQSSDCSAGH